ncbi:MAG: hypothetical protein KDB26_01415, partial [Microthrixaceae bacterium]|nr:hypothetical protein [Microthrixaceae bacterium]
MARERLKGEEADLLTLLEPRDHVLVKETAGASGNLSELSDTGTKRFTHVAGPFDHYERTVHWERTDEGFRIDNSVRFKLAIPYWGW